MVCSVDCVEFGRLDCCVISIVDSVGKFFVECLCAGFGDFFESLLHTWSATAHHNGKRGFMNEDVHRSSYMAIGPPSGGLTVSRPSMPFWRYLASFAFCSRDRLAPVPSLDAHIVNEFRRELNRLMKAWHLLVRPVSVSFSH